MYRVTFDNVLDKNAFRFYCRGGSRPGIKIVDIIERTDSFDVDFENEEAFNAFKAQCDLFINSEVKILNEQEVVASGEFVKLKASDFTTLAEFAGATLSDKGDDIISSVAFRQWSASNGYAPTQAQNAICLKDLSKYAGLLFKVKDVYSCVLGYKSKTHLKAFGIYQMLVAQLKLDLVSQRYGLDVNPSSTFNLEADDIVFARHLSDSGDLRIEFIRNNAIISGKSLRYTNTSNDEVLLGISQGWQGGGSNIVITKPMGVVKGSSFIKLNLTTDEVKKIAEAYNNEPTRNIK